MLGVSVIIDDGILVYNLKFVVGKFVKKEFIYLVLVRRVFFMEDDYVNEVKKVIKDLNIDFILILVIFK